MEIILLEKIQNLGEIGDLVNVRNGYARNYLIPQKKAMMATAEAKAEVEERKRQREITMKLFDMNEELAYLVHEIDEFVTHAEKQKELNPKMKKSAASMLTALKDLKAELVITTGDNYVGRAENELREDLSEIYNTIGSNFGAPTKSQLANVALMESRFNEAKAKMDTIRSSSMKKYNSALDKNELEGPKLKSFEEYVKKD